MKKKNTQRLREFIRKKNGDKCAKTQKYTKL